MAKSTSQARLKSETFVNFRPEPDPKSPARLTTLCRIQKIVLQTVSQQSIRNEKSFNEPYPKNRSTKQFPKNRSANLIRKNCQLILFWSGFNSLCTPIDKHILTSNTYCAKSWKYLAIAEYCQRCNDNFLSRAERPD